jgi:hypothetical protein|tara:strand:- start:999 stop:1322 length:324 start_codon:yes stop_codon:yes gene_type:complete
MGNILKICSVNLDFCDDFFFQENNDTMFTENSDSFEQELIEIETNFENTLLEINNDDNNHDNNENGYSQEVIIDDSPNKEKINEPVSERVNDTEKKYSPSKKINMVI